MSDHATPDLNFIGNQLRRVLNELGTLRDDVAVLTAITMRLDGTMVGLVNEVRAIHSQHSLLVNRVRELESSAVQGSPEP